MTTTFEGKKYEGEHGRLYVEYLKLRKKQEQVTRDTEKAWDAWRNYIYESTGRWNYLTGIKK